MGESLLATAGDTIKLWDVATYSFRHEIPFKNGHVSGLAWNQDGQCLASLGDSGEEISLSAICGKSEANIGVVRSIESPSCIKFACRSPHYLAVGSTTGTVTIWNIKSNTTKKVFTPTDHAISKIEFSHNDSHITAATRKGSLYMLSIVNNLTTGPYQVFKNQAITNLAYSRVKKSMIGCCSDGGSISLFDAHVTRVVHSFPTAHSSPVAALSFSPINELLMVSVGYDKMLTCYNVQTRQPVLTHRSSAPLTSVTFLSQGQLLVLGTMTGQLLVHDMRTLHTPLTTLRAHRTSVTDVLLQPSHRSKSVSSSSKLSTRNSAEDTLPLPSQKPAKFCSDQPMEMSPDMKPTKPDSPFDQFDLSVFSPIRETTNLPTQAQSPQPGGMDQMGGLRMTSPESEGFGEGVLSPVRTTDTQHNTSHHHHHQEPLSQWTMDVNEDNLLSPIRDTTYTAKSNSDSGDIKPFSTVEIISTAAEDKTNKENIKPPPPASVSLCGTGTSTNDVSQASQLAEASTPMIIVEAEGKGKEFIYTHSPSWKAEVVSPDTTMTRKPHEHQHQQHQQQQEHLTQQKDLAGSGNLSPSATAKEIAATVMSDGTVAVAGKERRPSTAKNLSIVINSQDDDNTVVQSLIQIQSPAAPNTTTTTSTLSPRRSCPPKKRQLIMPVQAADLDSDVSPKPAADTVATTDAAAAAPVAARGVPQLQMELLRSCIVDVMEEFQDEQNRRLMHLQYIMTKKFIQQEEVMEKLHRQYSLNEDLVKENEQLRQELERLQARY